MKAYPDLDSKAAYELVEELEAVPYVRPAGSRAYLAMARILMELCHGDDKMSPFQQARWVIDKALLWEEWAGLAGLAALFDSRFARRNPLSEAAPRQDVLRMKPASGSNQPRIQSQKNLF